MVRAERAVVGPKPLNEGRSHSSQAGARVALVANEGSTPRALRLAKLDGRPSQVKAFGLVVSTSLGDFH